MSDLDVPPCAYCGAPSHSFASRRCAACATLEAAIHANREMAQRMVAELVFLAPADWPLHFPGPFQHWPQSLRTAAGTLLFRYWAETFGSADLVKQITTSQFGQTALARLAELPKAPALTAGATEWWPFFLLVARAQVDTTALARTKTQPEG